MISYYLYWYLFVMARFSFRPIGIILKFIWYSFWNLVGIQNYFNSLYLGDHPNIDIIRCSGSILDSERYIGIFLFWLKSIYIRKIRYYTTHTIWRIWKSILYAFNIIRFWIYFCSPESQQLFGALQALCDNGIGQMILLRIRQASLQRSQLAQAVAHRVKC